MAPTISPSTSTRALDTRCTTALTAPSRERGARPSWQRDPELASEPSRDGEVGRTIVGLVQDAEVAPRKADASEAIRASRAPGRPHQVGAADAVVAERAVLARAAAAARRAVGAIEAVVAADAVVAAGEALGLDAERALAAAFAPLAGEATEIVSRDPAGGEPAKGGFELEPGHGRRIAHRSGA